MSKITKALTQAVLEKKLRKESSIIKPYDVEIKSNEEGNMKNSWLVWLFVVGVIATVVVAFNYEKGKNTVPLSEIFQEEQAVPVDVEYEIVKNDSTETITATAIQAEALSKTAGSSASTATAKAPATSSPSVVSAAAGSQAAVKETSFSGSDLSSVPFTIQVASFKEKSRAQQVVDTLKSKGYLGQIVARNLGEQGVWNRVYVGEFSAKSEADSYLKKIQSDFAGKINGFVISPQKAK